MIYEVGGEDERCDGEGVASWSAYMPMNTVNPLVDAPSVHLVACLDRSSSPVAGSLYLLAGPSQTVGRHVCGIETQGVRVCVCVCLCLLPSVMQKTLRNARSWAEMGGSLQCRAKMQDLKTRQRNTFNKNTYNTTPVRRVLQCHNELKGQKHYAGNRTIQHH